MGPSTTMVARARMMGMDLQPAIDSGALQISQIDPAELSPGEFANRVRQAVERDGVSFVVIDSLNAFLQAMPGEKYLLLQMHELLGYLNQQGVVTILVLALGVARRVVGPERVTAFLCSTRLPLVGELARLVRSLGFTFVWETWPDTSPTGAVAVPT